MTIPLPQLDTREWQDLVEDGIEIASRYSLGWTDHNVHDPGITLLELLAYKTEQSLYSANRVRADLLRRILALGDTDHQEIPDVDPLPLNPQKASQKLRMAIGRVYWKCLTDKQKEELRKLNDGNAIEWWREHSKQIREAYSANLIAEIRNMARRANSTEILVDLAAKNGGTLDGLSKPDFRDLEPRQAVTINDYECIALNTDGIARACAFPFVDFEQPSVANAAGTISIAIIPEEGKIPREFRFDGISQFDVTALEDLRLKVVSRIEEKRTLGTKIVVRFPTIREIEIRNFDVGSDVQKEEVMNVLRKFFHPLSGGTLGNGCPYRGQLTKEVVLQKLNEQIPEAKILDLDWLLDFPAWDLPVLGPDENMTATKINRGVEVY